MINMDNVTVSYSDGHRALDSITFNIKKGEKTAIIGANGAGKSTLINALVGLMSTECGKIFIDNIELNKKAISEIRKKIGVVFQNPDDQLFMSSVWEDIAFGLRNMGLCEYQVALRTDEILKNLGILHLSAKMPSRLSGGEKRTVALAGVLAMRPEIILFDEPSSFLDPKARKNLIKTLNEIPLTMIIATHDLDMVEKTTSRVIVLSNGKIAYDGDISILENEILLEEFGL